MKNLTLVGGFGFWCRVGLWVLGSGAGLGFEFWCLERALGTGFWCLGRALSLRFWCQTLWSADEVRVKQDYANLSDTERGVFSRGEYGG